MGRKYYKQQKVIKKKKKHGCIEVVFFPYKVSMADSFETIYFAAKADPDCNAVWCPIPYYDKDPEGHYRKVHYEDDYPEKFKVTRYWEYDVEKRHPDIIFIHNPYDGTNLVTSVHPDYYSSRLKVCTELLVYVDYGVPIWVAKNPKDNIAEDRLLQLPGEWNSDVIITYSEDMARSVKNGILLNEGYPVQWRQRLANNVKAMGSSKFDCVLNASKDHYVLPKEWSKIVQGKKIVLFNTSLAELLKHNERHIEEIQKFIQVFRKNNKVVLWWRPHPLEMSTLQSMRPQLYDTYHAIVEDFIKEKNGIYDDTDDLYRAITWSDGCLTTESSIAFLYLASGKPFSICNMEKEGWATTEDSGETFHEILRYRIDNMQLAKGANVGDWNCCIWWDIFFRVDTIHLVRFGNFLKRFLHFITHIEEYSEANLYRELQKKMFRDFVANSDGTAGEKIYQYCKGRITT